MNFYRRRPDELESDDIEVDARGRVVEPRAPRLRQRRPKRTRGDVLRSIVERGADGQTGAGLQFMPSLDVTNEERAWIHEHLEPFVAGKLITDVLRRVKGGKEATVYCCLAHPGTGLDLIAAKVYRPRKFRSLRNDTRYRLNRPLLDGQGFALRPDRRQRLALRKKTGYGRELLETSWLDYEFQTLRRLFEAGVDVPRPLRRGGHVILMEYVGDERAPAPALVEVDLAGGEARPLFERLMRDVRLMLQQNCVHGDLSAYNVLYWEGRAQIIDFPQVVDPRHHPEARDILLRDVTRLCQYFARCGVTADARRLVDQLWPRQGPTPGTPWEGRNDIAAE